MKQRVISCKALPLITDNEVAMSLPLITITSITAQYTHLHLTSPRTQPSLLRSQSANTGLFMDIAEVQGEKRVGIPPTVIILRVSIPCSTFHILSF